LKEARGIYLRLDREIAEKFSSIKKQLGLTNDTEVLRYLIAAFHTLQEREQKFDEFLERLYDKVDRLERDLRALEEQIKKKEKGET